MQCRWRAVPPDAHNSITIARVSRQMQRVFLIFRRLLTLDLCCKRLLCSVTNNSLKSNDEWTREVWSYILQIHKKRGTVLVEGNGQTHKRPGVRWLCPYMFRFVVHPLKWWCCSFYIHTLLMPTSRLTCTEFSSRVLQFNTIIFTSQLPNKLKLFKHFLEAELLKPDPGFQT